MITLQSVMIRKVLRGFFGERFSLMYRLVFNCRSANNWKNDLALTVTYFPHSRLTFGILFGCTLDIERQVLNRLVSAGSGSFHPLVLPGIFAELERVRMTDVVEATIDEIEASIYDLDSGIASKEVARENTEDHKNGGTRHGRRTVWLNTTYLRSRLQIWKTQLEKMVEAVDELTNIDFGFPGLTLDATSRDGIEMKHPKTNHSQINRTSIMIKDRLQVIIEEYDEKIEECSMRVDGMTIATQWVRITWMLDRSHLNANGI
jgi:hypothetical protein